MILPVNLAEEKKSLRSDRLGEFLRTGHIMRKKLESFTGRLSYSETSVSGRFGMGMMHPIYRKLNAAFYQSELSDSDRAIFQRRGAFPMESKPRRAISRNPTQGKNYLRGCGQGNSDFRHRRIR